VVYDGTSCSTFVPPHFSHHWFSTRITKNQKKKEKIIDVSAMLATSMRKRPKCDEQGKKEERN
jgi:hypothetical protein